MKTYKTGQIILWYAESSTELWKIIEQRGNCLELECIHVLHTKMDDTFSKGKIHTIDITDIGGKLIDDPKTIEKHLAKIL